MSTYSPSLRIELITTGDQAGTWGATTNTNLGSLIESAVAGYTSVSITSANQALTALNGAADEARNQTIALTTTTTANFNVYAPPAEKTYVIYNASSYVATIYNSTVIGNTTAAGTGVAIPAGKTMTVWSEGTNFRVQNDHVIGNLVGNVTGNVTGNVAGTLTGTISSGTTATTQAPGTNNTTVATTAFVQNVAGGLGTMSTQNANNVAITGGTITGSYGLTAANATNAVNATNATTVTNGVYTTGNQTIGGTKTFTNGITFNDATVLTTGGGAGSNTTNGYRVLPGGMILQWGSNTGFSNSYTTINFPVTFPNACWGVQCTVNNGQRNAAGDKQDATYTLNTTVSNFLLMCNYETSGSANVAWLAVGY